MISIRTIAGSHLLLGFAGRQFRRFPWPAALLPGAETALNMGHRFQPRTLGSLRGQRRAQAASTEEHVFLVLCEYGLVIGTLGVDPKFQHAARAMESARHPPLTLQLADVADIHQYCILTPGELNCLLGWERFNFAFSGFAQGLVSGRNDLRHEVHVPRRVTEQ